jgi:hypothetical protein
MPLAANSLFIFIVHDTESGQTFTINYKFSDSKNCLWSAPNLDNHSKSSDYFYSLGTFAAKTDYSIVIRDLNVDVMKAVALSMSSQSKKDPLNTGNSGKMHF